MTELLVIVIIAGRRCALRAQDVLSVIELGKVSPIPRAPAHLAGMTALRSQALTVVDCRRAIGCEAGEHDTDSRAPVVGVDGHSYALLVDRVEDIADTEAEADEVAGGFGAEWEAIANGMVETAYGPALLLDPEAIIAGPDASLRAA